MSENLKKLTRLMNNLNKRVDMLKSKDSIWCSFCGKEKSEVKQMIASPTPDINICNECVDVAYGITHNM